MNTSIEANIWICVRTGGVYSLRHGTREAVQADCDADNRDDPQGTTEILSGPFEEEEAMTEFDRLNS